MASDPLHSRLIAYTRRIRTVALWSFMSMACHGCYFDVIEENVDEIGSVSFSTDLEPIFENSCTVCHDGKTTTPNLMAGYAYQALINGNYVSTESPESSRLIVKLNQGHPYQGALTAKEIQTIVQWMKEGCQNN
ncbi:MAG: hypothetical protein QM786_03265 [Breznakibacter sp.]